MIDSKSLISIVLTLALVICASISRSEAEVSSWDGVEYGQARLLTAGGMESAIDGNYLTGVEIALDPTWKTYWKNPGGSGIPTTIDYSQSLNLKHGVLQYPVPENYDDGFSKSIVYSDHVLLPFLVSPTDPLKPVFIDAKLTYGVCAHICIPAEASFKVWINPNDDVDKASQVILSHALSQIPKAAELDDSIKITGVKKIDKGDGNPQLQISAITYDAVAVPLLFAHNLSNIYVPQPTLIEYAGNSALWNLSLAGIEETNLSVQFTLAHEGDAVESNWDIDIGPDF